MSPASGISRRVLDGLVAVGLMTVEQVASVVEAARSRGVHEGVVLTERAYVSANDVLSVLEHDMGVPQVDLASYAPEDEAVALVPASVARGYEVLPMFEIEGMLTVAVGDPMDVFGLDLVASAIGLEVEPVIAEASSVAAALEQYYGAAAAGPVDVPVAQPTESTGETPSPEASLEASDFFDESLDQT
ncbi:MAG: hypothetical protein XD74_1075, partial [Actinobacteria bacterium 66_15]